MRSCPSTTKRRSLARRASTERVLRELAVVLVVVGHQDRDRARSCSGVDMVLLCGGSRGRVSARRERVLAAARRQRHGERRAVAGLAVGDDRAAVALGDLATQRQADAGAADRSPRPCRRSNTRKIRAAVLRLEADAVVAHRDRRRVARDAARRSRTSGGTSSRRNFSALETRFCRSWRSCSASPLIVGSSPTCTIAPRARSRPRGPSSTSRATSPRSTGCERPGLRRDPRERAAGRRSAFCMRSRGRVRRARGSRGPRRRACRALDGRQPLGERAHLAQRLLQVVRGDRGELLELLVRARELGGAPRERRVRGGELVVDALERALDSRT